MYYHNLVRRIPKRLVAILMSLPDRAKHVKSIRPRVIGDPLDGIIAKSSHVLILQSNRFKCVRCLNSFDRMDSSLMPFLKGTCTAIGSHVDRPIPIYTCRQLINTPLT